MAKTRYENWSRGVFPGFYDTTLSSESLLMDDSCCRAPEGYWLEVEDEGIYRKEVCREWVRRMGENWNENPIGMRLGNLAGLSSPREYNFRTDTIKVDVEVNLNRLKDYCWKERASDFDDYLHKHWSSREGFLSFIPNRLSTFKETYRLDKSARSELVDIMVEWYLLEHIDWECVEYDVYERLYEIAACVGIVLTDGRSNFEAEFDNDHNAYLVGRRIA